MPETADLHSSEPDGAREGVLDDDGQSPSTGVTPGVAAEGSDGGTAGGVEKARAVWGRRVAGGVGLALVVAGVLSVLFVDFAPVPPAPDAVVRPVKWAEAGDVLFRPARRFPGEVLAGRTVDLAFQVGGPLSEADLSLGRRVAAGEVLGRIDPVRFQQQVDVLEPQVAQARTTLERTREIATRNAVAPAELEQAQATFDALTAQLQIAKQAVSDTVLKAPFDGLVVARFVEPFQNVQAGTVVVRLQDVSVLDVAVDLPESVVASYRPDEVREEGREPVSVTFPVRPGYWYPLALKEASAEADPQTGTFRVTYTMPAPEDLTALPGLSATLRLPGRLGGEPGQVAVPMQAVFVDDAGRTNVWLLETSTGGGADEAGGGGEVPGVAGPVYVARKREVTLGSELAAAPAGASEAQTGSAYVVVSQGLLAGDRVATAGVAFLREGQAVRLMESRR
ncbi:MAG: efflux RND transporter periplasmic adaptor subunit [Phycisphaerae bacterium]